MPKLPLLLGALSLDNRSRGHPSRRRARDRVELTELTRYGLGEMDPIYAATPRLSGSCW